MRFDAETTKEFIVGRDAGSTKHEKETKRIKWLRKKLTADVDYTADCSETSPSSAQVHLKLHTLFLLES